MKTLTLALSLSLLAGAAFGQSTQRPNRPYTPPDPPGLTYVPDPSPPPTYGTPAPKQNYNTPSYTPQPSRSGSCGGSACVGPAK